MSLHLLSMVADLLKPDVTDTNTRHLIRIVIDFETTGLNPYHDSLIEIGAKNMETGATFGSLIRPKDPFKLTAFITEKTGITPRMIRREARDKGWPTQDWISGPVSFYEWLQAQHHPESEFVFIAHNGTTFDFILLKQLFRDLRDHGHDISAYEGWSYQTLDTLLFARRLLVNQHSFTQENLCKLFHVPNPQAHRALADVTALESIYKELMRLYTKTHEGSLKSVQAYISLQD